MREHDRHVAIDWSHVVGGIGVLLVGIAALLFVLWLMLSEVKAVPFDADGTRCYSKAGEMVCIKTAEPVR